MGNSEFDDAYEDDLPQRQELRLGEAILNAHIRALDPKPVASVSESATIRAAIQQMLDREVGAVLIERGGRAIGIFTERDVLRRVVRMGIDQGRPVREVMTPDPETLGPDDGIAFALNRMIVRGFRNIPIVDDAGVPQAILSLREVAAFIVSLLPGRVLNLPPEPGLEARSEHGG